jgi:hypothetical protein
MPAAARQRSDDILHHPVGKILLLGIAAHVLERQHRDRRLVGQWQCRTFWRPKPNSEHLDFGCNVLQFRCAKIIDIQRHLACGILAHASRDTDATRFGQRFQTRCDDHAVAEQIVALCNYLALVPADAQAQAIRLRAQSLLDGDGAA